MIKEGKEDDAGAAIGDGEKEEDVNNYDDLPHLTATNLRQSYLRMISLQSYSKYPIPNQHKFLQKESKQ